MARSVQQQSHDHSSKYTVRPEFSTYSFWRNLEIQRNWKKKFLSFVQKTSASKEQKPDSITSTFLSPIGALDFFFLNFSRFVINYARRISVWRRSIYPSCTHVTTIPLDRHGPFSPSSRAGHIMDWIWFESGSEVWNRECMSSLNMRES